MLISLLTLMLFSPPQDTTSVGQDETTKDIAPLRHNDYRVHQVGDLQKVDIKIHSKKSDGTKAEHPLKVWVMDTYGKRQEGMMFLEDQDFTEKQGMLFVFPQAEYQRFWMRNTLVPLDIAYISADKTINSTYTMRALDERTDYSSAGRSTWVLEAKAGLFKKLGIKKGDKVDIPDSVKAKDDF